MMENGAAPRTETRIGRRRAKHDERRIMKKFYRISCFCASRFDRKSSPLGSRLRGVLSPSLARVGVLRISGRGFAVCNSKCHKLFIKSSLDLSHFP